MDQSLVLHQNEGAVAILTMAHATRRNVLSRAMLAELDQSLAAIDADRTVKCVLLRAEGQVFSAGHDLAEIAAADPPALEALFSQCTRVMERIRTLHAPVIAVVQGLATAAGCQLAATCDLVVAAETASFATPGVKIGLFCSTPAVALSRAVPTKKALEMLLTGRPLSAAEAERAGLVNRVVPAEQLDAAARELAGSIAAASGQTLGVGKQAFYQQLPLDRSEAYRVAGEAMVRNAQLSDAKEGMQAFLEKRAPRWKH